jgi:hypothetical protein
MRKNKSEKIILSAPKMAATLIITETLNIPPTILVGVNTRPGGGGWEDLREANKPPSRMEYTKITP